jgi:hypothetical protein
MLTENLNKEILLFFDCLVTMIGPYGDIYLIIHTLHYIGFHDYVDGEITWMCRLWEALLIRCGLISSYKLKGQNLIKENSEQYITRQMEPNEIGNSLEKNS